MEHTLDGFVEAVSRYQSFLAFHPTHAKAPYCQLQIARAYMEEMSTPDRDTTPARNALTSLNALIDNYPDSSEAERGRDLKSDVNDFLAAHEIKVGDYYFKSGSYAASIERYQTVLRVYPGYWNLPLVHARLAESYYRYGDFDKAANYFTEVVEEAPGTRLASNAEKRLQRIEAGKGAGSKIGKKPTDKDLTQTEHKRWWQFWKKGGKKEKDGEVTEGELVKPKEKRWWQFWK
jgi:outer membrane protein assembly factor BamD